MSKKEQKFITIVAGQVIGYNICVNNVYFNKTGYCIKDGLKDNFYKVNPSNQLVMGYFIYDIKGQRLYNPACVFDAFISVFHKEIENKKVVVKGNVDKYAILADGKEIVKVKNGNIVMVNFQKTSSVSNGFLRYDTNVNRITIPSLNHVGHSCFESNRPMKKVLEKTVAKNNIGR